MDIEEQIARFDAAKDAYEARFKEPFYSEKFEWVEGERLLAWQQVHRLTPVFPSPSAITSPVEDGNYDREG